MTIPTLISGSLAITGYLSATLIMLGQLLKKNAAPISAMKLAWIAATCHAIYLLLVFQAYHAINFGFFNACALVGFCIVSILLFSALERPLDKLGIVIFPLTAFLMGLDLIFPEQIHLINTNNWQMGLHILTSILAFSLLNIAAIQAIILAIQDQQLKSHHPNKIALALPPIQAMETLLFQMLGGGIFFLTIALASGFLFIDDLFAQHLVHKTVLSICAWLIFTGLLIGRLRFGWRGAPAIQGTLIGFVLLLLAYFGSKLVLEIILKR